MQERATAASNASAVVGPNSSLGFTPIRMTARALTHFGSITYLESPRSIADVAALMRTDAYAYLVGPPLHHDQPGHAQRLNRAAERIASLPLHHVPRTGLCPASRLKGWHY